MIEDNSLLSYHPTNTVWLWDPPENEHRHRSNAKRLGKKWIYFDKPISYCFNNEGFRTFDFKKINWNDSIVVFGDSIVFGTGLAEEDTICANIEKLTKIPTINLGISGSAVDIAAFNSIIFHNHFPRPKAIVHLWSSLSRYTNFDYEGNLKPILIKDNNYHKTMNWSKRSKMYIEIERSLWKQNVPRYEGTFFQDTWANVKDLHMLKLVDYARDLEHPGIQSATLAAEHIVKTLNICR